MLSDSVACCSGALVFWAWHCWSLDEHRRIDPWAMFLCSVKDLRSGNMVEVPAAHIDVCGLRCGARSKLNSERGSNASLDGEHSTGDDFATYVRTHDEAVRVNKGSILKVIENVPGFIARGTLVDGTKGDSFYSAHRFQFGYRGYAGTFRMMHAQDYRPSSGYTSLNIGQTLRPSPKATRSCVCFALLLLYKPTVNNFPLQWCKFACLAGNCASWKNCCSRVKFNTKFGSSRAPIDCATWLQHKRCLWGPSANVIISF